MTETVKRLLAVALIAAVAVGIVSLNNLFVDVELSTRVGDLIGSFGGPGFPAQLPGGVIRDMKPMGGNLALLTDAGMTLYNGRGKLISTAQQVTDQTVIDTNSDRVLSYEVGSRSYRLHTASRVTEMEAENTIQSADLCDSGAFALATDSRQFVAEVTVYSEPGEPHIFRWSSPDNHVSGVALSPRGDRVAVTCLTTENGVIKSLVELFSTTRDSKVAQAEFPGSMILSVQFLEQERIAVLTDREYIVLDFTGEKLFTHELGDGATASIGMYARETLLLTEYRESRRREVVLLTENGAVAAKLEAGPEVRDVAIDRKWIYILDNTGIRRMSRELAEEGKLELAGISRIKIGRDGLYYCAENEIFLYE
jgi:hypothetical protein